MIKNDKQVILDIIIQIIEKKEAAKQFPFHAMRMEVLQQAPYPQQHTILVLKQLVKSKIIKFGHSINDFYFKPISK